MGHPRGVGRAGTCNCAESYPAARRNPTSVAGSIGLADAEALEPKANCLLAHEQLRREPVFQDAVRAGSVLADQFLLPLPDDLDRHQQFRREAVRLALDLLDTFLGSVHDLNVGAEAAHAL